MRFWPKISRKIDALTGVSRKIDALTGVSLPQLRLRFVGGEFATQITKTRRYAARKKLCATHTKNPVGLGVKIGGLIEWGDGSIWSKNFTYWQPYFGGNFLYRSWIDWGEIDRAFLEGRKR